MRLTASQGAKGLRGGTEERSEGGGKRSTGRCQAGAGTTVGDDLLDDAQPDRASAKPDCVDSSTAKPRSPDCGTTLPCTCPPETVQFSHTAVLQPNDGGI